MNEMTQSDVGGKDAGATAGEPTRQVTVVGWTAGTSAFFAFCALVLSPNWPVAIGVAAVSVMVAAVCYFMLKR